MLTGKGSNVVSLELRPQWLPFLMAGYDDGDGGGDDHDDDDEDDHDSNLHDDTAVILAPFPSNVPPWCPKRPKKSSRRKETSIK